MINYKSYKEDLNSRSGTLAIKLPMNNISTDEASKVFEMSSTTEEQAVSNFINLLLTMPGERFMQPSYGIGIQTKLFENDGSESLILQIKTLIETQTNIWLPYILIQDLDVSMEQNSIYIIIDFKVSEQGANIRITLSSAETGRGINVEVE